MAFLTAFLHLALHERVYLAGFLDGDGCVNAQIVRRNDYVLKFQIRVSITFYQSKRRAWFMKKLLRRLGYGTYRERKDGMIEVAVVGPDLVEPLVQVLKPYVLAKHRQAKAVLEVIEENKAVRNDPERFLAVCKKVDRFAVWNDSKRRTIDSSTVRRELGLEDSP